MNKLTFETIFERKHIAACFDTPLRLTRIGPGDLAQHKCQLNLLLKADIKSGLYRSMAMELCFERLMRSFAWN